MTTCVLGVLLTFACCLSLMSKGAKILWWGHWYKVFDAMLIFKVGCSSWHVETSCSVCQKASQVHRWWWCLDGVHYALTSRRIASWCQSGIGQLLHDVRMEFVRVTFQTFMMIHVIVVLLVVLLLFQFLFHSFILYRLVEMQVLHGASGQITMFDILEL